MTPLSLSPRHLVLVDLAEDGGLVVDGLGLPAEQADRQARHVAGEGQLRSRQHTHCQAAVVGCGEPARSRAEVLRYQLVAHLRGPRPNALKAKVTHRRLLSSNLPRSSLGLPVKPAQSAPPIMHSSKIGAA